MVPGDSTASLTFDLGGEKTFDQVMVQEFIEEGQRVADWRLEVWMDQEWVEVVRHKTIGYKTVRRFDPVTASKVRFQILRSWDTPMIRSFGLYQSAPLPEGTGRYINRAGFRAGEHRGKGFVRRPAFLLL